MSSYNYYCLQLHRPRQPKAVPGGGFGSIFRAVLSGFVPFCFRFCPVFPLVLLWALTLFLPTFPLVPFLVLTPLLPTLPLVPFLDKWQFCPVCFRFCPTFRQILTEFQTPEKVSRTSGAKPTANKFTVWRSKRYPAATAETTRPIRQGRVLDRIVGKPEGSTLILRHHPRPLLRLRPAHLPNEDP